MRWNYVYAMIICSIALTVNLLAVVFMLRNKNLRKSRFNTLVLYLSISDCCLVLSFIIHAFFDYFNKGHVVTLYGCMVQKHTFAGILGFTEWQTAMICFERLQATFQQDKPILKKLTSDRSLGLSFIVSQLYSTLPLIYEILQGPYPCHASYSLKITFILPIDIPVFCSYCALVTLFGVLIYRINKLIKRWMAEVSTGHMLTRNRLHDIKRMKKSMITLGFVIIVLSLAILPREICSLVSIFVVHDARMVQFTQIANYVLLVLPLVDPFIYVLRIGEVRKKITCCSRRNTVDVLNISVQPNNQLSIPPVSHAMPTSSNGC